jgi:SAM-dependent methyltransferase
VEFANTYRDPAYADAYAKLAFAGTYLLAYRDLPDIFRRHARGRRALDFGCGAGRSTRFLKALGFDTVGVDIAAGMLAWARDADPGGDYRLGDLSALPDGSFDAALAAFTFDNIPQKTELLAQLRRVLAPAGVLVLIVSTPDMYTHEWVSFTTKDFPANWTARPGDIVRTRIRGIGDERPVDDVLWPDESYRATFAAAGLGLVETRRPLATGTEGEAWISETGVAPWAVYVLSSRRAP